MTKEFVNYEQALALRELEFNEPCFTSYGDEGDLRNPFDYSNSEYDYNRRYIGDTKNFVYNSELTIENFIGNKDLYTQFIAAPLYQQAFRWFREKHDKHCYVEAYTLSSGGKRYDYTILSNEGEDEWDDGETWETYEQAELACLKKLIEIVKNK
jgi:hypothetical protein